MGLELDPEVKGALTRSAINLGIEGATALLRGAIERKAGRNLAELSVAQALITIRQHEAERTFETTDELVSRGAAQAGAGEVDEDGA